ncbi:protein of unknown function [Lentzea xinjiangensis]|uniref:eCIS core domain-containing protein n=1 Tax=Lentzea xinjiangensis TaxID=402600 RepID=A0A1H9W726_9PSEU|nr:DUF4157 domain-containing protein [Lentzea xinjiangensis]SES29746.1 protein of unknown function [Lentzea xinjiangensis]
MRTHGAHGREELPGSHPRRRDDDAAAQHRAEEALAGSSPPRVMSPDALVRLQRSAGNAAVADLLAQRQAIQRSALHGVLRAPGRPLDDHTRADMESRLDADFSDVRVHDDAARDVADQFDARALTAGSHVVIGESDGDPHTLAHELAHVVQQRHGPVAGTDSGHGYQVSDPSDRFEREAEAVATRAMSGPSPAPMIEHHAHGHAHTGVEVQRASDVEMTDDLSDDDPFSGMTPAELAKLEQGAMSSQAERASQTPASAHAGESEVQNYNRFIDALIRELRKQDPPWSVYVDKPDMQGRKEFKATLPVRTEEGALQRQHAAPHTFDEQPATQALRWISSVVKVYLQNGDLSRKVPKSNPIEVQAGITGGRMVISANDRRSAENLHRLVGSVGGDMAELLAAMANKNREQVWPPRRGLPEAEEPIGSRLERHHRQLADVIENGLENYGQVLTAIRTVEVADKGVPGLHAERRIHRHLGEKLPEVMAGTKRPCATCYALLYPNNLDIRPGAFYGNYASNADVPEFTSKDQDVEARARRVVARLKAAGVTATWDSRLLRSGVPGFVDVEEVGSDSETGQ